MAPKITLAVIVYSGFSPETMRSLGPLLVQPGVRWGDHARDGLVSRGRSFLASRFLESDSEVLLHLDADIRFSYQDALKICEQAVDHSIVGGVYVGRRLRSGNLPTTLFLPDVPVEFNPHKRSDKPVEVMFPAGGFMAVHRRVFEKLAKRDDMPMCHDDGSGLKFQPFYLPYVWRDWNGVNLYLSEDWALTGRAREEGFTAYINPGVRLGHGGWVNLEIEDAVPGLPSGLPPQRIVFTQLGERRMKIRVGDDPVEQAPQEGEEQAAETPEAVLPPGVSV